jgi:TRAP-type C4-dicarboxylate transport system permease large subunit
VLGACASKRELTVACTVGGIKIKDAVKVTLILFIPMILVPASVILMPDAMLSLPRTLMRTLIK